MMAFVDHPGEKADAPFDEHGDLLQVMQRISGTSPADIMNVRMIVEPKAASVSAANARPSDLIAIRNAHELALASPETEAFEAWDSEFHKRIFESTRNDFLTALHDILKAVRMREQWLTLKRRKFTTQRRLQYCDEHAAIYQAIYNRDPRGASDAMLRHMTTIRDNLFG
jgi:DNA-binding FadR family transcriptional regulator